ncbi:hypothetical protein HYPDE_28693 [Hyphomicrobium denitrificans 1NES1]|uniref:Uncharacterized protein n=1 Tax=Hyphomicrobium denitrificans 1NES1 TaxID=670307 RepID=N0B351_9HYPH|nr:hypothetical protein [Hyphomicrobium denitrificans]AGK57418.1 hypothetical protein HYPDE_28693 [Hyphomicrobium denitrificans 1NES1]
MVAKLDPTDVPQVATSALNRPMQMLIANGQGLALLKGLSERELRVLEGSLWSDIETNVDERLAVALRFRALIDVFAARRLKDMLLERGFKVIAAAIAAASEQRLNARFGFNAQRLLLAIDAATEPSRQPVVTAAPLQTAA